MYTLRNLRQPVSSVTRKILIRNVSSISISHRLPLRNLYTSKNLVKPISTQFRTYSVLSSAPEAKIYKYEDVKDIIKDPSSHPDTLLIDVREPVEYKDGHIPGSINIPFKSSPGALDLPPEEFQEQFGFDKPPHNKELVFYCLGGVRSTAAEELANTFGYKKRGNYVGSWEEWAARENAQSKPSSTDA